MTVDNYLCGVRRGMGYAINCIFKDMVEKIDPSYALDDVLCHIFNIYSNVETISRDKKDRLETKLRELREILNEGE